jgi:hypothetical protein
MNEDRVVWLFPDSESPFALMMQLQRLFREMKIREQLFKVWFEDYQEQQYYKQMIREMDEEMRWIEERYPCGD